MSASRGGFSVLIIDGESEFALFAAHCLARYPEVEIHVLSNERWAPIRLSRYLRSYTYGAPTSDEGARLGLIADVVRRHKVDVLLPTGIDGIAFAVANRDALASLTALAPIPDAAALALASNKWLLARFQREHGIPGPPTVLVSDDEDFRQRLREMAFPVLLKPAVAWGGDGIERFETLPDAERWLGNSSRRKAFGQYIVQTFLPGHVVGINLLARDGRILAMTIQRGIIPNSQKYAAAGAIRFFREDRIAAIAEELVSALNWNGFANLDALADSRDGSLKILEINARFWGSLRGSLVADVSFPYLACLAALDRPFERPEYMETRYFHTVTALRESLRRLRGKSQIEGLAFRETGLQFLVSDPVAESLRALRQRADRGISAA